MCPNYRIDCTCMLHPEAYRTPKKQPDSRRTRQTGWSSLPRTCPSGIPRKPRPTKQTLSTVMSLVRTKYAKYIYLELL